MPIPRFRRARTAEKKKQRKQDIIVAAEYICDTEGLEAVTYESIAHKLGFTRPLIYSYFRTREELLAAMLDREFTSWTADILRILQDQQQTDPAVLASKWSDCMARHPRLIELCAAREVAAKSALSNETRRKLTERMSDCKRATVSSLERICAGADHEAASLFFDLQMSLAIGLRSLVDYTRTAAEAKMMYTNGIAFAIQQFRDSSSRKTVQ
ncbi:MAG: TetR/AcrR family transcriptional regulator [Candidatus Methanomethylophilus sp.]|nr:TetR/AcrR family transcriptional regulator [Methanomethylophilus sp.]MDD4222796.1 TetR/AcrR family transcriptional regulator [Methanomethylophilus sp.]